jgi:hypothetical protein
MRETIKIQHDTHCHIHIKGQVRLGSRNTGQNKEMGRRLRISNKLEIDMLSPIQERAASRFLASTTSGRPGSADFHNPRNLR